MTNLRWFTNETASLAMLPHFMFNDRGLGHTDFGHAGRRHWAEGQVFPALGWTGTRVTTMGGRWRLLLCPVGEQRPDTIFFNHFPSRSDELTKVGLDPWLGSWQVRADELTQVCGANGVRVNG